jgi:hypothetical protein
MVNASRRGVQSCVEHGKATGIIDIFHRIGLMPVEDVTGHRVAKNILLDSLKEGMYH